MGARSRILIAALLLAGAVGLARMSSAARVPTIELLHRAETSSLSLPLEWVSLMGFAATGGLPSINGSGDLVLPIVRVSDDIWGISEPDLEAVLAGLPKPLTTTMTFLPDEGLMLRWEPIVEILEPVNADFLGATGAGGTRLSTREIGWGPNAAGKDRDQFPPQELRRCVIEWHANLAFHQQPRGIAAPGFLSATPDTLTFSCSGSLEDGCSPDVAYLNVGRSAGGVIWIWFSTT